MLKIEFIKKYAYTPAIVWGILITYFSLLPSNDVPGQLREMSDQLLHGLIYGGFTLLLVTAEGIRSLKNFPYFKSLFWLAAVTLYGGIIEIVQENYIPGREGEWRDMLANLVGAIFGLIIAFYSWKVISKQEKTFQEKL